MSYDKINFVDGQVLTADQLNHMESGIERAIPNPDTAAVGQTIRVSAVDSSGKPTAWEAVDFPTGGGGGGGVSEWEVISTGETTEEVTAITISNDMNGNPFRLQKAALKIKVAATTSNTSEASAQVRVNVNSAAKGVLLASIPRVFRVNTAGAFDAVIEVYNGIIWGYGTTTSGSAEGLNANDVSNGAITMLHTWGGHLVSEVRGSLAG